MTTPVLSPADIQIKNKYTNEKTKKGVPKIKEKEASNNENLFSNKEKVYNNFKKSNEKEKLNLNKFGRKKKVNLNKADEKDIARFRYSS